MNAVTKQDLNRRNLTICAIGNCESTHTVNRAGVFAERGHFVYLICGRPSSIAGIERIVPQARPLPWLNKLFSVLQSVNARVRKTSIAHRRESVQYFLNHLSILWRHPPDIVHVHYAYQFYGWLAAAFCKCPLVVSVMGGDVLFEEQGAPTKRGIRMTHALLRRADLITAKSDYLIEKLNELGGYGAKAIRVPWGVDRQRFRPLDSAALRAELGFEPDARIILSPKILQPFYNIHLLVEALPKIIEQHPKARLLVTEYLADAGYRAQIMELIERLSLADRVTWAGHIQQSEMPRYYCLADAVVSVPSSDGLPQSLLEAMACGAPNILSKLKRYEEVVTADESAVFVDISADSIAQGVNRLLSDEALRTRIAANGLELIGTHADFSKQASIVENEYYRLLEHPVRSLGIGERLQLLADAFCHLTRIEDRFAIFSRKSS